MTNFTRDWRGEWTWMAFFLDLFIYRFCLLVGVELVPSFEHRSTLEKISLFARRVNLHVCRLLFHPMQQFSITKLTLDFVLKRERKDKVWMQHKVNRILVKATKANDFCLEISVFSRTLVMQHAAENCWVFVESFSMTSSALLNTICFYCDVLQVSSIKSELIYKPKVRISR